LPGSARIASLCGPRVPIIEAILFNAKMERPPLGNDRLTGVIKGSADLSVWKNVPYIMGVERVTDLRMCRLPIWPRSWRI